MGDPEFLDPRAFGRGGLGGLGAVAPREGPVHRAFEAVLRDGLEHVVHRVAIERLDREVIVRGHEDHGGTRRHPHEAARDAEAVDFGHRHVEQYQFGRKRLAEAQRGGAVACGADHVQRRDSRAEDLHALHRERFIIDDQGFHWQRTHLSPGFHPQSQIDRTSGIVSTVA